jgi:hypothetical protein
MPDRLPRTVSSLRDGCAGSFCLPSLVLPVLVFYTSCTRFGETTQHRSIHCRRDGMGLTTYNRLPVWEA